MASCAKCPHQEQIRELARTCRACVIGRDSCGLSNGGVSWVHMDAAAKPETVYAKRLAADYVPGGKADDVRLETPCDADERERYLRFLQTFAELSWDDAGLVCALLAGKTIDKIAAMRGVAYETVFLRWQKVKRRNPVFASLANGLMGVGYGRKRKTASAVQGDLLEGR